MTGTGERGAAPGSPLPSRREEVLRAVLEDLDLGRTPDLVELRRRFSDDPAAVSSVLASLERYGGLRSALGFRARSPVLAVGERVGGFEVESFLERGAVGEVYRAKQVSLGGRRVALKVVRLADLSSGERSRFLREAQLAARLSHPNLVQVIDSGEDERLGVLYHAMRLVEGPTLHAGLVALARSGPPDAELRRRIVERVAEIASALAVLHERGLVHRDVKPANVVLEGGDGSEPLSRAAVLVDLGLARAFDARVTCSSVRLTVPYAAPERLLGKPADPRADVFSLGVTLYDLLGGRLPEDRGNPAEGLVPLRRSVPGVDDDLDAIVARATDPTPGWRYPDAQAIHADLRAWLEGRPVGARARGALERFERWVSGDPRRLRRAGAWIAATVILVGLALGLVSTAVRVSRGGRDVRLAWERGELERVLRVADGLPAPLLKFGLSAEDRKRIRELRDPATPLGEVAHAAGRDPHAALVAALSHLQRDGPRAHPALVRFVERRLLEAPGETVSLVARLFVERPDEDPADAVASAPLREALIGILGSGSDPWIERFAVSALGGCGTPEDAGVLSSWLVDRVRAYGANATEDVRLAAAALGEILFWRADPCVTAGDADRLETTLADVAQGMLDLERVCDASAARKEAARLLFLIEICRRRCGLEPGELRPAWGSGVVPWRLRAARLDPEVASWLEGGPGFLADWKEFRFLEYGFLVGLYAQRTWSVDPESAVLAEAERAGTDPDGAVGSFRMGRREAADVLVGRRTAARAASDTYLGALAEQAKRPWESIATEERSPPPGAAAGVVFDARVPAAYGNDTRLATRCASWAEQELRPGRGFALLGVSGISAVRVSFVQPRGCELESVRLVLQRGVRDLLPDGGNAIVEVRLDGNLVADGLALRSGGIEEVIVPLRISPVRIPERRELLVRLSDRANTTVRVHELSILESR